MLTTPMTSPGRLIAFADHDRADWHYVVAAAPRLISGPAGGTRLQLLRWLAASGDREAVGGRLTLGLTLAVDDRMLMEAGLVTARTGPLPWSAATVEVSGPGFSSAPAPVAMATPDEAMVAVDLDAQGADILGTLLQGDAAAALQVAWSGYVRLRMPPAEVRASASREEITQRVIAAAAGEEREVVRSLIEANVQIDIRAAGDATLEQALYDFALDRLWQQFSAGEELLVQVGAAEIIDFPVRLSASIEALGPVSTDRVQTIILDDVALGRPPRVAVQVLGDFAGDLERVDVEIEQGEGISSMAFTDLLPQSVALADEPLRWRSRAKWQALPPAAWSGWHDAVYASSLLVPVQRRIASTLEVVAVGIDFVQRWQAITIALPAVANEPAQTASLAADRTTLRLDVPVQRLRTGFALGLRYLSMTGLVVDRRVIVAADQELVLIRDPYTHGSLQTALVPTGNGWDEVAMVMVDLRYQDGDEVRDETLALQSRDDFAEWRIPVREDGPRDLEWRYHASFVDGRFEQSAWQRSSARLLTVPLMAPQRRELQIVPVFLEVGETVELRITIGNRTWTETLEDRQPRTLRLPTGPYQWQAVWRTGGNAPVAGPVNDSDRDVIVIPRSNA